MYILVNYDNNIYGDKKVKNSIYIIIIFAALIILPGCSNKNIHQDMNELLRTEQLEIFDKKVFSILENVLGLRFANYRLVTVAQESTDTQQDARSKDDTQQNQNGKMSNDKNDSKTVKTTEIVDDNTIFEKNNEPNWEEAKQYVRQASDIFIDIQIELKNINIGQEEIQKYGSYISQLVYDVSNEDKEKSIKDLQNIYANMYDLFSKNTDDSKLLSIRKVYYDVIQLMICLEGEQEDSFNELMKQAKEDINAMNEHIKQDNEQYLKERIDMLFENIDYSKKSDARLKIVMLVNCIPILEFYDYE